MTKTVIVLRVVFVAATFIATTATIFTTITTTTTINVSASYHYSSSSYSFAPHMRMLVLAHLRYDTVDVKTEKGKKVLPVCSA